jgi:hypothetical protein
MLVTPDSAFFINRIERTYGRYATQDFFKEYNLPADFDMFSKVLAGGAYLPPSITRSTIEADGALLLQSSAGITARHWLDTNYKLVRSHVVDPQQQEWNATYGNYNQVNTGQSFPFHRGNSLMIKGETNLFDLDYTLVEVNVPQSFPFSIPSHYEKI